MGSRSTRKRNPVQTACFSLSCGQSKGKESRRLTAYEKKMQAVGRIRVGICAGASALIGTPTHFLDLTFLSLERANQQQLGLQAIRSLIQETITDPGNLSLNFNLMKGNLLQVPT